MWFFYAIISPVLFTVTNFIDKYLLSKIIKDYFALPVFSAIISTIAGIVIWIILGFPLLSVSNSIIIIGSGVLTIWSIIFYFKALSEEETSIVILLFQLIPIFSLIFSLLVLHEPINGKQYVGFFLVLLSTIVVVYNKKSFSVQKLSPIIYVIIYDILCAVSGVMMKFSFNLGSFWSVLTYECFGIGIGGIVMFLLISKVRAAFVKQIKRIQLKSIQVISINEVVFVVAKSLGYYAFSLGPVALVSVIGNTQVFFGIFFGILLTKLFPSAFHEKINKKSVLLKIVSSVLLFIGLLFII